MTQRKNRWHHLALSLIVPATLLIHTSADAAVSQGMAIGYKAQGKVGQVTINDAPVLVIRGSANAVEKARAVALKLNQLSHDRMLRPDQIVPAMSEGKYEVRVGKETLLVVDPAMAQAEKVPPALVAMRMINQLRKSLGGVPYETQATRGLMAGSSRSLNGEATWYGGHFNGRFTSSGERYDVRLMTCAHRTLPFGTLLLVTHTGNGRSVLVKVNDRGPWTNQTRIVDLSPAAFRLLAPLNAGVIPIKAEVVSLPQ